jgi:hypothetical protein
MKKVIPIALVIIVVGLVVYYFASQFTYSEGNRAGLLVKFSQKGYVFKTYEGELNLGGVNTDPKAGLMNNMWDFSSIDKNASDQLMQLEGKYVRVHYRQVLKNFPWQGETQYFVDSVTTVK